MGGNISSIVSCGRGEHQGMMGDPPEGKQMVLISFVRPLHTHRRGSKLARGGCIDIDLLIIQR